DGYISVDFSGGSNGYELELVRFSSVNPPSGATVVETVDFIELAGRYTFSGLSPTAGNEGYAVRLRNKLSDGTLPDENCAAYLPGNYIAGDNFTPITLSAPPALQGGSVATAQPLDCTGAGATLTISGVTGGTPPYEYSVNGSDFSTATTQGGAAENDIIVRDANGCTLTLQHSITEVAEAPLQMSYSSLPPRGCDPVIEGQLVVDLGVGPFTYAYAPTADGNGEPQNPTIVNTELATLPLEGLTAGTLFVRLTSVDGCSKLFSYTITDPGYQPLTASTTQVIPESCVNDGDGSITVQAAGGVAPYQIVFAGVITTEATRTVSGLSSGRYVFGIRDAAGCSLIQEVELNPSSEGFPITISGDPATPCADTENGSITITPTGGVAPFTLAWSDGAPGATINSVGGSATRSNLSRAEYPLTITDGNGCTVVRSPLPGGRDALEAEIINVIQPTCGGAATGGFTVNITRNSFPESSNFLVSINGAAPVDQLVFSNLAEGDYQIDVIDDSGCGLLDPLSVTLEGQSQINVTSDVTDVTCGGEATGSVTLTATGGTGPFQYALGMGVFQASPTFNGLAAGTYNFRVQDAQGCIAPLNDIEVTDGPTITGTVNLTSPACNGELGSLEIVPSGGTPFYTYSLNGGAPQTSATFTGLAGSLEYSVLITDTNGCTFTTPAELLAEPEPVAATPTPNAVSCFGDSNGSIEVLATGGNGIYEYSINGGAYAGAMNFTGLAAGGYQIQVRDGNGCESPVVDVTITSAPAINASITGTTPENCGLTDGSATATASGGTGTLTLSWPGGQTGTTATNLTAGSYQLTVTDQNNCEEIVDFTIPSAGGPNLSLVNTIDANCSAADGTVEVSNTGGGVGPFTYTWSHDAGLNAPLATGLAAGDYSVTITDANNCSNQLTTSVGDTPPPSLAIDNVSPSLCQDGNGSASVTATGGTPPYTYDWSHAANQNSASLTNLVAGDYTVSVTDANNCFASVNLTITLVTGPTAATGTTTPTSCVGATDGSITIAGTGGTTPLQYRLNGGDYSDENSFTGLAAGDYSIQVRDANACESPVASVTIDAPQAITASITETTPENCGQADGTASATASGGTGTLVFSWPGGQTGTSVSGLAAGSYQLTITDQNSCEQLIDFTILSAGGPNLLLVNAEDANCGAADGSIEAGNSEGTAPFTYTWSHDAALNAPLATGLGAGDYSVTITDANTCTSQLMVSISESAPPSLTVESVTPSLCTDGNGAASVLATSGIPPYTYVWSHDANQNTASLTDLVAGDYTVSVTDANACTASVDFSIDLIAGPTAVMGNTTPISCADVTDGSITIVATGGTLPLQYRLNGGDYGDEASFTGLAAGDYSIQARDANGCESPIETVSLAAPPAIMAQVTNTTAENCNQADGTATASASGGTEPLTLSWPGGQSGNTAIGLTAGNYQLTVTDANNCTLTIPFNIPAAGGPVLSLVSITDASCEAANGSIEVSTTEGTPPYTYTWSHDASLNASIANNLPVGDYSVTVTDINNCTNTLSASVGETPKPVLSVASVTTSLCTNDNGSATVAVTSGTGPFSVSWSHDATLDATTADNLPAGTYTVLVTDANNCTDEVMLTVGFIPGLSAIDLQSLTPTTCGLDNGSITLAGNGGTPPYRYEWANFPALTGGTATDLPAGDYSITVFDANDCSLTQSFSVPGSVPATLVLVASADAGCSVANGSIEVSAQNTTGLLVYSWSHDANLNAPLAENLPAGAYTVMVTDANNCTAELSVTIGNTEAPTLSLSESSDAICMDGTGSATIGATGGVLPYTYAWSHTNVLDSPTATNLSAGSYSATVTDANGCAEVLNFSIDFIPGLQGIDLLDLQATTCGLDNGRIEVGGIGGTPPYRYEWLTLPGLTTNIANNLPAGNYSVTVFDANDCSITELYAVAPSAVPEVTLTSLTDASCGETNGRIEVNTSGFTGLLVYEWSHDANLNEAVAENLAAGTYSVLVRDELDCSATLTISVSNLSAPGLEIVATNNSICTEGNGSIEVSNTGGGLAPFTYTWSHATNLNAPLAENLASGDYGVTITDALGCQSVVNTTVELEAAPAISGFDLAPALCAQNNGSATVNFTGGTPPLIYTWSHDPNLNAPTATNLPPGQTSLTITDRNGCFDSQNFTIESEAGPASLVAEEVIATSCGLDNGRLELAVTDGVAPLVFSWSHDQDLNTNIADNLPSGTYSVTV
ncbi:MAG: SprB repeat-containing protein, partial [Bacteroidota bacterium]